MLGVCADTKAPPRHEKVVYVKAGLHKNELRLLEVQNDFDFKVLYIMTYDLPR